MKDQFKNFRSTKYIELETSVSLESTTQVLRSHFQPKVLIVNHEKRLGTDTTCSNLAIKYNLIYLSVYQIIGNHIKSQSEWGKKLLATKRERDIMLSSQVRDEFNEAEYTPAHYSNDVVIQLLKHTVQQNHYN